MRKNQSGCVCKLDEEGENIIELCGLHADYFNALLTNKWEVVEECHHAIVSQEVIDCHDGKHPESCKCSGTGTITRQSTWEEVEELLEFILNPQIDDWMVDRRQYEMRDGFWYYILKSGGRLRRKEAEE